LEVWLLPKPKRRKAMQNLSGVRLFFGMMAVSAILCLLWSGVAMAVQTPDEVLNDPRFIALEGLVDENGLTLDHKPKKPKVSDPDVKKGTLLFSAFDTAGEEAGLLSVYNDFYGLSVVIDNKATSFYAELDSDGNVNIVEDSIEGGVEPDFSTQGGPQWGYNWCIYVSKLSVSFACWNPQDNPFGYYFVSTYREGDPITPYWQAWWADYRGRIVVCPRNEKPWSPFLWTQCGFPPY
jgi:hypothetical protein